MPFGNRKKNILEDRFSSPLSQFKKYHPSRNVKFNNLDIIHTFVLSSYPKQVWDCQKQGLVFTVNLNYIFTVPKLDSATLNLNPTSPT